MFRTKAMRLMLRRCVCLALYCSFLLNMVSGLWWTQSVWICLYWFNVVSFGLFVLIFTGFLLWMWWDRWIEEGE